MGHLGTRKIQWTEEMEDRLLDEIENGKKLLQLENLFKVNKVIVNRKLKEMGFDGFRDARRLLHG